jgi:hypothetical protein
MEFPPARCRNYYRRNFLNSPEGELRPDDTDDEYPYESPLMRRAEAIRMLRGEGMLRRCERSGWLAARARSPGYVVYRREDVLAVVARIDSGELPPRLSAGKSKPL